MVSAGGGAVSYCDAIRCLASPRVSNSKDAPLKETGKMSGNLETAMNEATKKAGADGFIADLAERVGAKAKVDVVFGPPVERGAISVIPVAKVRWGFGGGGGSGTNESKHESGSGSGGGGGAQATPIGFIEISDGIAEFRPIKDPASLWPLVLAGAVATVMVLGALRKFFK